MIKEFQGLLGRIGRFLLLRRDVTDSMTSTAQNPVSMQDDISEVFLDAVRECWDFAARFELVALWEDEDVDEEDDDALRYTIRPEKNYCEQMATFLREYLESRGYTIKSSRAE